jgi:hypothetical protein
MGNSAFISSLLCCEKSRKRQTQIRWSNSQRRLVDEDEMMMMMMMMMLHAILPGLSSCKLAKHILVGRYN